jgi:hypothetical protein
MARWRHRYRRTHVPTALSNAINDASAKNQNPSQPIKVEDTEDFVQYLDHADFFAMLMKRH